MKQQPNKSLEQQIVDALSGANAPDSATLASLITQTNTAIKNAETMLHIERNRITADPLVDVKIIRDAINDCEFRLQRFQALLPRLAQRLAEVEAAEEHVKWVEQYEALKSKIAAAAEHWLDTYPDCIADLVNLISENESFTDAINRINLSAPSGEPRRLRSPELTARGEPMGTRSILADLKLVDLDGRVLWPLPQRLDPSVYVPMSGGDPRSTTGDWWKIGEEARQRRAVEEEELLRQNAAEHARDFGRLPAAE